MQRDGLTECATDWWRCFAASDSKAAAAKVGRGRRFSTLITALSLPFSVGKQCVHRREELSIAWLGSLFIFFLQKWDAACWLLALPTQMYVRTGYSPGDFALFSVSCRKAIMGNAESVELGTLVSLHAKDICHKHQLTQLTKTCDDQITANGRWASHRRSMQCCWWNAIRRKTWKYPHKVLLCRRVVNLR